MLILRILRPVLTIVLLGIAIFFIYQWLILPLFFAQARVVHLIDADTLLVQERGRLKRVQLIGADAPELTGPQKAYQCYDNEALRQAADFFAKERSVSLSIDGKAGEKDVHGRDLRYVTLADGRMYNLLLLENGLAIESNPFKKEYKHQKDFLRAQEEAKAAGLGLWDARGCGGRF